MKVAKHYQLYYIVVFFDVLRFKMIKFFELIPQREPFVLVDEIVEVSESSTVTSFSFDESHILCSNGHLIEAGVVENIAQSAAAGAGYHFVSKGRDIPIGFIGSVDKLVINFLPRIGDIIKTEINIDHKVMNVTLVSCISKVNGEVAATCKMKIFIIEKEEKSE